MGDPRLGSIAQSLGSVGQGYMAGLQQKKQDEKETEDRKLQHQQIQSNLMRNKLEMYYEGLEKFGPNTPGRRNWGQMVKTFHPDLGVMMADDRYDRAAQRLSEGDKDFLAKHGTAEDRAFLRSTIPGGTQTEVDPTKYITHAEKTAITKENRAQENFETTIADDIIGNVKATAKSIWNEPWPGARIPDSDLDDPSLYARPPMEKDEEGRLVPKYKEIKTAEGTRWVPRQEWRARYARYMKEELQGRFLLRVDSISKHKDSKLDLATVYYAGIQLEDHPELLGLKPKEFEKAVLKLVEEAYAESPDETGAKAGATETPQSADAWLKSTKLDADTKEKLRTLVNDPATLKIALKRLTDAYGTP